MAGFFYPNQQQEEPQVFQPTQTQRRYADMLQSLPQAQAQAPDFGMSPFDMQRILKEMKPGGTPIIPGLPEQGSTGFFGESEGSIGSLNPSFMARLKNMFGG